MALATYFLSRPLPQPRGKGGRMAWSTTLGFPFLSPYGIILNANRKERNAFCQKL